MPVWELWRDVWLAGLETASQATSEMLEAWCAELPKSTTAAPAAAAAHPSVSADPATIEHLKHLGGFTACYIDAMGAASYLSPNWEQVTGLTVAQCEGIHFDKFFHPQHREQFHAELKRLYDRIAAVPGAPELPVEFRAQYGSTHIGYKWYDFRILPRADADGAVQHFAVLMRDIAEEVEAERVLKAAHLNAELAQRGRTEFLGHMSHELRTPLNAIMGFAEMMEKEIYGPIQHDVYKEYLGNIRESGQMLLERINDMLEIASIEVGGANLDETRAEPEHLIAMAKTLCHHQAFCHRVTVHTPAYSPLVLLRCDQAKITRALGNLLSNAIRFSAPGGEVHITCDLKEDNSLVFGVHDHGEGIAPHHLARMQEALVKGASALAGSPETVTLGLGLSAAREFVRMHSGGLWLESEKNKGTAATLMLPSSRITSLEAPLRKRQRMKIMVG